jgi:AcrR family transcriptional regulator
MVSRERILEAAARVYAKHGFKGATTRAIAIEADVNEVTLFRTFGSKSALLEAVLIRHVSDQPPSTLPAAPSNPHEEVKAFIQANLARVNEMRPLLIHTMGELEERAEAKEFACRGRHQIHDIITTYIRQLQQNGLADPTVDVNAAAVMLTGTVMSDVMGRPIVPDVYPPLDEVAEQYATLFLRAIGVREMIVPPEETPIVETTATGSTVGPTSRTPHTQHSTRS